MPPAFKREFKMAAVSCGLRLGQTTPDADLKRGGPMLYAYPYEAAVLPDGTIKITFPDVPEVIIEAGADPVETRVRAHFELVDALRKYVLEDRLLPVPSPTNGRPAIRFRVMEAAKLALHEEMVRQGVSNAELGRRLKMKEDKVQQLRDPGYRLGGISTVEQACRALGKRLDISISDIPSSNRSS